MAFGMVADNMVSPNIDVKVDINKVLKGVGIALAIVVVIVVLYFALVKPMRNKINEVQQNKGFDDEMNQVIADDPTQKPTMTDHQALLLANQLENEMTGVNFTNTATLSLFDKIKTQGDWVLVKKKFGTREKQDLYAWISSETNLTGQVKSLFAKKGIEY